MLKAMLEQFRELEKETIQALTQLEDLRRKIQEASGMDEINDMDVAQIPFAAYEMQLERNLEEKKEIEERHLQEKEAIHKRHEEEKDKMRKHYRNIIIGMCVVLTALIVGIFATVFYVMNTYDFMSFNQDGAGINNYAYNAEQGDLTYEPAD